MLGYLTARTSTGLGLLVPVQFFVVAAAGIALTMAVTKTGYLAANRWMVGVALVIGAVSLMPVGLLLNRRSGVVVAPDGSVRGTPGPVVSSFLGVRYEHWSWIAVVVVGGLWALSL